MTDYDIVFITPEMMIPELGDFVCDTNFRGGLGILAGDIMESLIKRGIKACGFTPLHRFSWISGTEIDYDRTSADRLFDSDLRLGGEHFKIGMRKINRGGADVYGLASPVFDLLYCSDRRHRLLQEVLLGHAVPMVLERLGIKPKIIWYQEGHTSLVVPVAKENSYFNGTKYLFTTHTSVPEGMEKFYGNRFGETHIHFKYHDVFVRNGMIDMTWGAMALADRITAVSLEHGEIVKNMFPEYAHKITGILNGSSRETWLSSRVRAMGENITPLSLWEAHQADKEEFLYFIYRATGAHFDILKPMLGWVRRIAEYKNQWPMLAPILPALCGRRGECVDTEFGRLSCLGFQHFGAGLAHESDILRLGWMQEFERCMRYDYRGKLVFLPNYSWKLRRDACWASDVWLSCPMPHKEACGTSEECAVINGNPDITTKSGGAPEYVEEYNPITGQGNGFFIDPYCSFALYNKLKIVSDLYYAWVKNQDPRWLELRFNSYKAGLGLDAVDMIGNYEKVFDLCLGR